MEIQCIFGKRKSTHTQGIRNLQLCFVYKERQTNQYSRYMQYRKSVSLPITFDVVYGVNSQGYPLLLSYSNSLLHNMYSTLPPTSGAMMYVCTRYSLQTREDCPSLPHPPSRQTQLSESPRSSPLSLRRWGIPLCLLASPHLSGSQEILQSG